MKKLFLIVTIISIFILGACNKCSNCTYVEPDLDETFQYDDGDEILVTEGTATYKEADYAKGSTFTIEKDTGAFANGLQFTGNVVATRTKRDTFCSKGNIYTSELDQHESTGWECEDGK